MNSTASTIRAIEQPGRLTAPHPDKLITSLAPRVAAAQSDAVEVALGVIGPILLGHLISALLMSPREPARRLRTKRKRLAIELLASVASGAEGRRPPWTPAPA